MKILQINSVSNTGSTGRIAEGIAEQILIAGGSSVIAYGRTSNKSDFSDEIQIGCMGDVYTHGIMSLLFDRHGFGSQKATKDFLKKLDKINPDIIHLHNIHGYYINIELLFNYLKSRNKPLVWTLHDCWSFTGHCTHYTSVSCDKWESSCFKCPIIGAYPKSLFVDNSKKNYREKKKLFAGLNRNLTKLVTPSQWLADQLSSSFLNSYSTLVINNGIDIQKFKPMNPHAVAEKYKIKEEFVILGVAGVWDERKGLSDFVKLHSQLNNQFKIIIVGLKDMQIKALPKGILGIKRTESIEELAALYSLADVFFNPTYEDNFPTTNLESLACGTPVLTYRTGGSPESVSVNTGAIINVGDLNAAVNIFEKMKQGVLIFNKNDCRNRAELLYNQDNRFKEYIELYKRLII